LNEAPRRKATLVDITCDSDGDVDKFVDRRDIKEALEVHDLIPDQPYYLAFLLVGGYQDTMGDMHNLFGRVNEAEVSTDTGGETVIRNVLRGDDAAEALSYFGYGRDEMIAKIDAGLSERVRRDQLNADEARDLLDDYRERLGHYTYLD
jgi:arginine decarboxylase